MRSGKNERISRIMQMFANKQNPIDFIEAGDIGAAVGFKEIKTGDTLCDEKHPIVLENMFIPEPVIAIAIEPKAGACGRIGSTAPTNIIGCAFRPTCRAESSGR